MVAASELTYNTSASATAMAQEIFGAGTTIVSASYSGDNRSSAIFSDGDTIAPGVTPGDTGVILSTGRADDFTRSSGSSNQSNSTSTNTSGQNNNSQFNTAAGTSTYDASYLDVDFVPSGSVMTMQFVFASEEYPEYVNSLYQDFVGVWINGAQVNLAIGDGDIDPGNVNSGDSSNLFIDNTSDAYNTEMDGFTLTMTLTIPVDIGVTNSIRIGIADVGDSSYDSSLLIAGDSLQTTLVANDDSYNVSPTGSKTLDLLSNDVNTTGGTLTITHINGQPVSVGSTVTLPSGQTVVLNANGTVTLTGDGDTEDISFTYGVESSTGQTDAGLVLVDMVPCFVAGTLVDMADGCVRVEDLVAGDLVMTRDRGAQPIRWIGSRTIDAVGPMAPIEITAGTFGDHATLLVSPLHRVMIRDVLAELLFGEPEVLVPAKELVNDRTVRQRHGGQVTYVHMLFDQHEIVTTQGLQSESFLPGPQINSLFEEDAIAEICTLFPELDPETGDGYSLPARRILRKFEAALLHGKAA